nr:spheroidene monooxygenase [Acidimicrobiia bacterium]
TWATGLARPPFVSTCSLWESSDALAAYAYGHARAPHPAAMQADRAEPFHHQSAFVRWRPRDARGHLEGRNPLPETWSASV